jgi:RNA polymerase sigma-70 factor, ECF subfamily
MFTAKAHHRRPPAPPRAQRRRGPIIELRIVPSSRELAVLVHRTAARDTKAFAELYDATAPRVYGMATRILRSPAEAQEVTLESYLDAWRTSDRFDEDECSAIAWMLAIVLCRVADEHSPDTLPRPLLSVGAVPHARRQVQATSEETDQILAALTRLRPEQVMALELACRDRDDTGRERLQ